MKDLSKERAEEALLATLAEIRKNPYIYLGIKSLERLRAFITGYLIRQYELFGGSSLGALAEFGKYVEDKYHCKTTEGYVSLIYSSCSGHEEAFDLFYVLLDEYLKTK